MCATTAPFEKLWVLVLVDGRRGPAFFSWYTWPKRRFILSTKQCWHQTFGPIPVWRFSYIRCRLSFPGWVWILNGHLCPPPARKAMIRVSVRDNKVFFPGRTMLDIDIHDKWSWQFFVGCCPRLEATLDTLSPSKGLLYVDACSNKQICLCLFVRVCVCVCLVVWLFDCLLCFVPCSFVLVPFVLFVCLLALFVFWCRQLVGSSQY